MNVKKHKTPGLQDKERINKDQDDIEQYFSSIIEKTISTKIHFSNLSKRLSLNITQNTWHFKEKWELELNVFIEDEIWDNLWKDSYRGINSQLWK